MTSSQQHARREKTGHGSAATKTSSSSEYGPAASARPGPAHAAGALVKLPGVQAKLSVGQAGDRYEREADHAADRVTSGQSAGDISRIPAGGLGAQRQPDGGDDSAQGKCDACANEDHAQRAPAGGSEESEPGAQRAANAPEEPVQRQAADEPAQPVPAATDKPAQTKCAACEAEGTAQRQADDAGGGQGPADDEDRETEDREAADERGADDVGPDAKDCVKEEAGPDAPEGKSPGRAGPDLSCGEGGEEEETPPAAGGAGPGGAGGGGCAKATAAGTEAVTAAAGMIGVEPSADQAPPPVKVPGCADDVEGDPNAPEGPSGPDQPAQGPQPAGGAGPSSGPCATAQRKEKDGEASQRAEDESQSKGDEEGAAQRQEDGAQSKEAEEGPAQRAEDEAQSKDTEKAAAQHAKDESQSKGDEEGAAQRQEDGAQSKEAEGPAQRAEDEAQSKETDECQREEDEAQTRPAGPARRRLQTEVASRHIHARGSGDELLPSVRDRLEANLGVDLEGVRVHTDSNAQAASQALRAKAFTYRNHIFLGPGQSPQDVALLAHESTHVLQQDAVVRRKPARAPDREEPRAAASIEPAGPAPETATAGATTAAGVGPAAPATLQGTTVRSGPSAVPAPIPPLPSQTAGGPAKPAIPTAAATPGAGTAAGTREPETSDTRSVRGPTAAAPSSPTATPTAAATATPVASALAPAAAATTAATTPAQPPSQRTDASPAAPERKPGKATPAAASPVSSAEPTAAGMPPGAATTADGQGLDRVLARLDSVAQGQKAHAPAHTKAKAALAAAKPPPNEGARRADAKRAAVMDAQEPGETNLDALYTELCNALNAIPVKTLEDVDDFKESGKAAQMKGSLQAGIGAQKEAAASGISQVARAPDPTPEETEGAVPLPAERAEGGPPQIGAREALPAPRPDAEISNEDGKEQADKMLAEHDLDEEQLREANEPEFTEALAAKKELEASADALPGRYRKEEAETLAAAGAAVESAEEAARLGMHGARAGARTGVRSRQEEARLRAEAERQQVANQVVGRFNATRDKVRGRLKRLDEAVSTTFDTTEAGARNVFETYVSFHMDLYKEDRYGHLGGGLLWLKDKVFSLPDEVNKFYVKGRQLYVDAMKKGFRKIVDLVEGELKAAKQEIADGRCEIDRFVCGLHGSLAQAGADAAASVSSRFAQLEDSVEDKKNALRDDLVRKAKDARGKLDARIVELKKENEGYATRLRRKLGEIKKMLGEFKDRISGLLHASGDVLWQIVKHPIRFLGNLLRAVKGGFNQFKERFGEHLKKSVVHWLFGTLGDAGIEIPSGWGAKAIFGVVLQVIGATPARLRARLAELIGSRNVERLEVAKAWLDKVIAEGPAGLWELLKEKFADLKELVLGAVREYVEREIVKKAIAFVVSLFSPVSALLRAIKLIYDVVMFIVENIDLILKVLEAVVASLAKIVAGQIQSAADWIETTLGNILSAVIAFLARVFGISGVADRIRSVIKSIRDRVDQAIDWVLSKVAKGIGWVARKVGGAAGKTVAAVKRFLFPSRSFRAGKELHRLHFESQDPQAQLLVSSDTKRLRKLVKELAARRDQKPGADKKLAAVEEQLDAIDAARKVLKTDPSSAAKRIDAALALIAKHLAPLLADDDAGTIANPYGVVWPKRPLAQYDRLYVGPKVGEGGIRISQDELAEARTRADTKNVIKARLVTRRGPTRAYEAWKARGFDVDVYDPAGKRALPEGGETIGVDPIWQVRDGMKFELHPGGKTGGGGKINRALKPYGYSAGAEVRDGDHVLERQVGGADALENLWPLDLGENRASGSTLASTELRVPGESTTIPMEAAKKKARTQSVWLVIDRTGKAKRRL